MHDGVDVHLRDALWNAHPGSDACRGILGVLTGSIIPREIISSGITRSPAVGTPSVLASERGQTLTHAHALAFADLVGTAFTRPTRFGAAL